MLASGWLSSKLWKEISSIALAHRWAIISTWTDIGRYGFPKVSSTITIRFNTPRNRIKKEPLPKSFMLGLSGSLFISYISGHIRGSGLAMIQLECIASPFPVPDVVLSSSAQASRAFSGVRMFFFIFSMVRV